MNTETTPTGAAALSDERVSEIWLKCRAEACKDPSIGLRFRFARALLAAIPLDSVKAAPDLADELDELASDMYYEGNCEMSQEKQSRAAIISRGAQALKRIAAPVVQATPNEPRKYDDVLLPFLSLMRKELHANSRKGDRPGWLSMHPNTALLEVYWHAAKLSAAVKNNDGPAIMEHSADVANMAMMVLDVCGALAFVEPDPVAAPVVQAAPVPESSDAACGTWYCEQHPLQEMGHDGCSGAGIPECARVQLLANSLRLAKQEIRETAMHRDDLVARLRAAAPPAGAVAQPVAGDEVKP